MTNPFESDYGAASRGEIETLVSLTDMLLADVPPDVLHRVEFMSDLGALVIIAGEELVEFEDGEPENEDTILFWLQPVDEDGQVLEDEEPHFRLAIDEDGVNSSFPPSLNPNVPAELLVEDIDRAIKRVMAQNSVLHTDKGLYIASYLRRFAEVALLMGEDVEWRANELLPDGQTTFSLVWNLVTSNTPTAVVSREVQFPHKDYDISVYSSELTNPEAAPLFKDLARISLIRDSRPKQVPVDTLFVNHHGEVSHRLYTAPDEPIEAAPGEELSDEDKALVTELRRGVGELGVSGEVVGEYSAILMHQLLGDIKE